MPTVRAQDYKLVFSLNKQNNIHVGVTNSALDKMRSVRTFAPIVEEPVTITDRNWYGKGHSFSSFVDRVAKMYRIPATERSATALELLWAAAYVLGAVQTTQPSTALAEYQHVCTFQDTTSNKLTRYTSIGEAMGAEYKKKLIGAWLSSFTLSANRADHVLLSVEGGGREFQTSTFTVPSITSTAFFKTLFGTVTFGLTGAEAAISAEVLSWRLIVSQDPQPMFLMGNSAGDEMLLAEVLIGMQSVNLECVIKVNVTHRDRFLDDEECGITLYIASPDLAVAGGSVQSCSIAIPNLKITSETFGTEGNTVAYTLMTSEEGIIKSGATEPITMTFNSNLDDSELLVYG